MNRLIRGLRSTLGAAVILGAFALTLPGAESAAFDSQESAATEQQRRRHHAELTFTQIDVPGAASTIVFGANDRGQIGGNFGPPGAIHGYLLDQDVFTQIDVPGASQTIAPRINERGQIVGTFADAAGVASHGFLATKERFSGKAIDAGADRENAAVEIAGTFTSPTDLDLGAATLTITSVLDERAGGGELVRGPPLTLTAIQARHRHRARFEDPSRPNFASAVIARAGAREFTFRLVVRDAPINAPQQCSPARLTTSFRLDAAGKPPIIASTERAWFCFGPSNTRLKTR